MRGDRSPLMYTLYYRPTTISGLTDETNMSNFRLLEVVVRGSETQLLVDGNLNL